MTKKTLISAVTAALVVGAASTTFAAANPFSDVPTTNWAYQAVATLARDGVVVGYPNGTFQGQRDITRYEMAQIIARVMAREDLTKADKALVDKLAVEFAQELDNLGVCVANLEQKSDNVKLTGKVSYTYKNALIKNELQNKPGISNTLKFRLEPTAFIGNTGWTAHARMDYDTDPSQDTNNDKKVNVDRIYVEGTIGQLGVMAGKHPVFLNDGMVIDSKVTGATLSTQLGKKATIAAIAGRYNGSVDKFVATEAEVVAQNAAPNPDQVKALKVVADVYGTQVGAQLSPKVGMNAGYLAVRPSQNPYYSATGHNNIWFTGVTAEIAPMLSLQGDYARASQAEDGQKYSYSAQFQYRQANTQQAGSYDVWAGYRRLGNGPSIDSTYDEISANQKGWVVGTDYVPAENIKASVKYYNGKQIKTENKSSKLYANIDFLF